MFRSFRPMAAALAVVACSSTGLDGGTGAPVTRDGGADGSRDAAPGPRDASGGAALDAAPDVSAGGATGSGGSGGSGGSSGSSGSGGGTGSPEARPPLDWDADTISYEGWLAAGCDCTEANPCPMWCGGVTGMVEPVFSLPVSPEPACVYPLSPEASCSEPRKQVFFDRACDAVYMYAKTYTAWPGPRGHISALRTWYRPGTLEQTGWEYGVADFGDLKGTRVCGGVVPREEDCTRPLGDLPRTVRCASDQQPHLCACPPPPCDGPCPNYGACDGPEDCLSGRCEVSGCYASESCFDDLLNGPESDVDCGGLACGACPGGAHCNVDTDCQSQRCSDGTCAAP